MPLIIRELVVPIIRGKKIMAVLGVGNKNSHYNETDVKSVQRLADVAWETVVRKQAEENLKNTFDISPSIISKANIETGYFIEANQAVTRILGYTVEEFTSRPLMDFIHPDDSQSTNNEISEQMKANNIATFFENRYLCKNGSYKWIAWHCSKADENGVVTAIGTDIEERKLAEVTLIKSEERYRNLVENIADVIFILDEKGVVQYISSNIEFILGYTSEDIVNHHYSYYVHHDDLEIARQGLIEQIQGSKNAKEFRMKKKEGDYLWVSALGSIKMDTNSLFQGVLRDITERKIIEQKIDKTKQFYESIIEGVQDGIWDGQK